MKKVRLILLLVLLVVTSLGIWLVARQPSGPSIADIKRIGIHALAAHKVDKSCSLSVLDDARLSQCTSVDEQGLAIEKHYHPTGRLQKIIHRVNDKVATTTTIEHDDLSGNITVSTESKLFPDEDDAPEVLVVEICRHQSTTKSVLQYRCTRTLTNLAWQARAAPPINQGTHLYQYDATSGVLLVQRTDKPSSKQTRRIFDQHGILLEHHVFTRQNNKQEQGYFFTYHYQEDEVLMATASVRASNTWLSRQWDALTSGLDSSLSNDPALEPPNLADIPVGVMASSTTDPSDGLPGLFIKVLKRDEHGNPVELDTWESPSMEASKRRETRTIGYR